MIHYLRYTLYTALVILGFFLYQAWVKDHPVADVTASTPTVETQSNDGRFVPQNLTTSQPAVAAPTTAPTTVEVQSSTAPATPINSQGQQVHVSTDTLQVNIDTRGGDVTEVKLSKYPESLNSKTPFILLNDDPNTKYIAESGLLSPQGPDVQEQAQYSTDQTSYMMDPQQNTLAVKLHWQNASGLEVNKIFTFARGSYEIKVAYEIVNRMATTWDGKLYTQLTRKDTPPPTTSTGFINLSTFFGAAISTPDKPFDKLTFKNIQEKPLDMKVQGGWAAMIQHYFISAWVPPAATTSSYYSRAMPNGLYTVGMVTDPIAVAPGQTATVQAKLYAGPSIAKELEKTAPNLNLTIDFGLFWFISGIIFWMMQLIYDFIGNWGWSIVLVTIIIKLIFYPLSAKSYRSMRELKRLQPKIEAIRERYKDDKQQLTQKTLELYKQEKVNPMSGCLPILIQIPVFIALYWVLVESVELRQAPFILWIQDLSQHDPYYILPILMGASMFIQQLLNPPAPDPVQQKVMLAMPIVFTVLFANFPAGLMLYWFVNNTLSFLQQWMVMRSIEGSGKKKDVK